MNTPAQRTVYLVDDNPQFRSSAQWWLSGAGYQVRDFAEPQRALDALRRTAEEDPGALRHACLLLDVRMPGMSGLDLHDLLADSGITRPGDLDPLEGPGPARATLPVVYMTAHGDVSLAVSAMQKGAVTLLEKPFADNALEAALERAFAVAESDWERSQGAEPLPQRWPETPQQDVQTPAHEEYRRRLATLSKRQRTVFDGIVSGKMSKHIAYECGLSSKTVEFHRKGVMEKMKARSALELLRMAVRGCVDS